MCDFGEGGIYAFKHGFCFVFFFCRFLLVTMKDISAFLDMRRYKNYKAGSRKHLTM